MEVQTFDNSILDTLRLCHAKCMYRYGVGLVRPGSLNTAALFGEAIHAGVAAGLRLYQEHFPVRTPAPDIEQAIVAAMLDGFDEAWDPEAGDEKRNTQTGHALLQAHFTKYWPWTSQVVAVEEPFHVFLGENVNYAGRIDSLHFINGRYLMMDIKTTSSYLNSRYFDQWRYSLQLIGYCVGVEALIDEWVEAVVVDAMTVTPSKSSPQLAREKFFFFPAQKEMWFRDCVEWIEFFNNRLPPELRGKPFGEIQKWMRAALEDGEDISRFFLKSRSTPTCRAWFRQCTYYDLCHLGIQAWQSFEFSDWLPYQRLEERHETNV